jgi:hypothetical protein
VTCDALAVLGDDELRTRAKELDEAHGRQMAALQILEQAHRDAEAVVLGVAKALHHQRNQANNSMLQLHATRAVLVARAARGGGDGGAAGA